MAKGDKIKVSYERAPGAVEIVEVVADKAGRSVAFNRDARSGLLTLEVLGRAGTAVRTVTIRLDKVIVMEEIPA